MNAHFTSSSEIPDIVTRAAEASLTWAATPVERRAQALEAIAGALDSAADQLVPMAKRETHLTEGRLQGELVRTSFQLRLFAEVVRDGGYLDSRIDHADPEWPMGARPDLRRTLIPIGPVVVFAASNFPFAFSVIGGDTASALAAGNSVVLKVHSGHPELSRLTGEVVASALRTVQAPDNLLQLIYGTDAGVEALTDPRIKAGAFTGSIPGGRALFDLAQSRPEPIPFYGELGSLNPVFVSRSAATERAAAVVDEYVKSFTLGAGQFCTKPGLLLHPAGSGVRDLLEHAQLPDPVPLLNDRIQRGFATSLAGLAAHPHVAPVRFTESSTSTPPAPSVLATSVQALIEDPTLLDEVFGPATLIAEYEHDEQLLQLVEALPGQLTATLIANENDTLAPQLIDALSRRAGRILWNEWPTGVTVSYAQQHGGPYPATTASMSTSVGSAAISRFIRPVAYQNLPQSLLPANLRDEARTTPALVDGKRVERA
ncbi:aldehyde dehydrogenase (NADP(+)) [Pseudoclavibacter sp. CFCC 13796]|uniref:aldehyde dehydrogenase (NADP(+)) n=1 Tax=Pseudoclavibacter sp. CFCC 13796 TaxID=2615179 RepID=UPI001300FDEB|nr:aldehyde dehydrogenase (NADP(+)) [Pseudoclavibacter sp. CFCC 13796]KAB1660730.1 aldehyde dehydrogenase (NADP(+)) [Pseudoclavibacter sp. CFCC 13796]